MSLTVSGVKKLVEGGRRSNQAVLAFDGSATDGDSMAPGKVGLHYIEGVKVLSTSGSYSAQLKYLPATSKIQLINNNTTATATVTVTAEFVGW